MLKAIQISTLMEQQAATAEMELAPNTPAGAAAMEYDVQAGASILPVMAQPMAVQQNEEQEEEPSEMKEFNLFRDYLGLINLVKSFSNVPESPSSDYSFEQELRERRDSLGSAGSEFSSSNSAESVEIADIYYNAYGHDGTGMMKQAFMDCGEDSLKGNIITGHRVSSLPTSLQLLEHKIITATTIKKPQVSST